MKDGVPPKMKNLSKLKSEKPENIEAFIAQEIDYGNIELEMIGDIIIYHCTKCDFQNMRPLSLRSHIGRMHKNCPPGRVLCPYCPGSFSRMGNLKRHFRVNSCPNKK